MSNENELKKESNKKLKIVNGHGKIDISPVSSHLEIEKPKNKKSKEDIFISIFKLLVLYFLVLFVLLHFCLQLLN